jgi:hypothetical protein
MVSSIMIILFGTGNKREKTIVKSTIFAFAFFSLTLPAFGQGVDPFVGTWKFNAEKSSCHVAGQAVCPIMKSETLTVSKEGQNIVNNTEGVDAQGRAFKQAYQHIYDGTPHPTTGSGLAYDSTTYTRTGNTIDGVRFKEGKTVQLMQGVIVPGKTYTATAAGIAANGQPYNFVFVYDRQ